MCFVDAHAMLRCSIGARLLALSPLLPYYVPHAPPSRRPYA